ncbi:hypothetical protein KY290_027445 [Solanum tuberosum]|uniref:Ulp1 protease family, C-terminal catalytic domain containing protein n=1 Tax=Solanum tuberosum TaxID=4113 RepID=A0ABQ7UGA5_SOLTU|nr:hypothetical protein KY290_027445 [Solanum tuberosum]
MPPRRKNATKLAPSPTASQLECHDDSEASSSEVQINVTPEDHSPRATRAQTKKDILQDTPPQSEEGGSHSGRSKASGSESNASSEVDTRVREEAATIDEDVEITDDDTMVMYVNIHEPDPAARPQLIACYLSMWTVNRSKKFFNKGIVTKNESFKRHAIMPETRVVVVDIKVFPDIYWTFQFHQFDWMENAPGEYSSHLAREFYSSYAATLMNFVAETETTKCGQRDNAITWVPLNSIIVRGESIDISEATINRMLHGPNYTVPFSVGLFEGKHHAVTSDTTMEIQESRERVLC